MLPYFGVIGGRRVPQTKNLYEVDTVLEKPTPTQAEQELIVPGLRAGHYLCFFGMHVLTPVIFDLLDALGDSGRRQVSPALAMLAGRERYLAYEVAGNRSNLGVTYGLLVAQLALALSGKDRADILSQLVDLALQSVESVVRRTMVETTRRSSPLNLSCMECARKILGHLAKNPLFPAILALLDDIPVGSDLLGAVDFDLAENMRMATDQLLPAVLGNCCHIAGATLLQQQREEVHLKQHITKLVNQLGIVTRPCGIGQLVCLFKRMWNYRPLILLAIPRTLHPECPCKIVECFDRACVLRSAHAVPDQPPCVGGACCTVPGPG
jgi:hypothetical protein